MKSATKFLIIAICSTSSLLNTSCSNTAKAPVSAVSLVLVGSTPGDSLINSLLNIHSDTVIDFIRWELTLNNAPPNNFDLNINFGVGKPNTNGFMEGGEKRSYKGKYTISKSTSGNLNGEIYQLTGEGIKPHISLIKLNDNLFHLLTPDNKLMVGNGGWSYSLNRKTPIINDSAALPALTVAPILFKDTATQITFQGRTPCQEFTKDNNLQTSNDCIKLKWGLTLNKTPDMTASGNYSLKAIAVPELDKPIWPNNASSGNYSLKGTLYRSRMREGKWAITKGTDTNPEVAILQLDPDKPDECVSFLLGDENVLFLLNKKMQLYSGNSDFSFTLNRRNQQN